MDLQLLMLVLHIGFFLYIFSESKASVYTYIYMNYFSVFLRKESANPTGAH